MNIEKVNASLADTQATLRLGMLLGQTLDAGSVLLLQGNLGSGKTTLVQGIGKGLNVKESIVSPTFTLINEYTDGRIPLYHVDLYRLETEEVPGLNLEIYWEGLEVQPGILAIEWAEKLIEKPSTYLQVDLNHTKVGDRQVKFSGTNDVQADWLQLFTKIKNLLE